MEHTKTTASAKEIRDAVHEQILAMYATQPDRPEAWELDRPSTPARKSWQRKLNALSAMEKYYQRRMEQVVR